MDDFPRNLFTHFKVLNTLNELYAVNINNAAQNQCNLPSLFHTVCC